MSPHRVEPCGDPDLLPAQWGRGVWQLITGEGDAECVGSGRGAAAGREKWLEMRPQVRRW